MKRNLSVLTKAVLSHLHRNRNGVSRTAHFYVSVVITFAMASLFLFPAASRAGDAVQLNSGQGSSAVLFEWFHAAENATAIGYHGAQTFTPSTSHVVKRISVLLWNANIFRTGPVTIGISETDVNGLPSGKILASGTIYSTLISNYWTTVTVDLEQECELYSGTKYAIRIDSPNNDALYARVDTSGTYKGGYYLSSDKLIRYWVEHDRSYDIWFEEWGVASGTVPPSVETIAAFNVGKNSVTLAGNLLSSGSAANLFTGFEIGTTTAYGRLIASQGSDNGTFTANVAGLKSNTIYHFRAVASDNSAGTNRGTDYEFSTDGGLLVRYEFYWASQNSTDLGFHAAQTFIPGKTHIVKQIRLKLWNRNNLLSGDLTVGITATDRTGMPAGNFLASGTLAKEDLNDGWNIVTIDLSPGCKVNAGQKYAIRIDSPNEGAVFAQVDGYRASYGGGNYLSAERDMTYWIEHTGFRDLWFEEWGVPVEEYSILPPGK